jgi:predicted Fe-Mo cluster-binding NifX family protein
MWVVITANGTELDAQASSVFGRCPVYVFVDTESMQLEGLENPAIATPSGAGIQAAQFVVERGAQAVVTGNVGPNAYGVFQASGVPVYVFGGGTVREAVEAYVAGQLEPVGGANVPAYSGMGGGMGRGRGRGRGMGMGRRRRNVPAPVSPTSSDTSPLAPSVPQDQEATALRDKARALREQLAQAEERLKRLEDED